VVSFVLGISMFHSRQSLIYDGFRPSQISLFPSCSGQATIVPCNNENTILFWLLVRSQHLLINTEILTLTFPSHNEEGAHYCLSGAEQFGIGEWVNAPGQVG
jgi:hypothetical protein